MKKYTLFNYVLEDDSQEHGGVSYNGQTLYELAQECGERRFFDLINDGKIKEINKELKECGIMPIDKRKLYNGWQVSIEICENGENKVIVCSPLFKTEARADKWYRELDFTDCEFHNLDIIILHYKNGSIDDTYLIG